MSPLSRRRRDAALPRDSRSFTLSFTRSPAISAAQCSGAISLPQLSGRDRCRAHLANEQPVRRVDKENEQRPKKDAEGDANGEPAERIAIFPPDVQANRLRGQRPRILAAVIDQF